jgi:hypothetical protein
LLRGAIDAPLGAHADNRAGACQESKHDGNDSTRARTG